MTSRALKLIFAMCCVANMCNDCKATDDLEQRVAAAASHFDGAEDRFTEPDPEWFKTTQQALREETERVGLALDSHGNEYSAAWKKHLRWHLLEKNLGDPRQIEYDELALVRRWLYSNRKGLEYPFFAELRRRADDHLDAAYTLTQDNLEGLFRRQVELARRQMWALALDPSDANAAALGRTLGWFEQTRQLPDETAAARELLARPNAQVVIAKSLIDRAIALLATEVEQTLPVSDRVTVPNSSLLGQDRTANVHGTATTKGFIDVALLENRDLADLNIIYTGQIESNCRAVIGPINVAMQTLGPVRAVSPVHLSLAGVKVIATKVDPQVDTKVKRVSARSNLIRRLGERRVYEPESLQHMNSRARVKASMLIQEEMDQRVSTVIDEIRAELRQAQSSMNSFQEVLAPVVREGAAPRWDSIQSSAENVTVNALSGRREQFGAVSECPLPRVADIQVRLHVSFFNNLAETIMAGKTFTDRYFMDYGKIVQAQVPPVLMVHSRSTRWAIVAAKPRPLEITIPAPNQFKIQLNMQRVDIGEEQFTGPTTATVHYSLVQNEFDEYQLDRQGEVQLDSPMTEAANVFLLSKLNAFFAPVLTGNGVVLPEGGSLARLQSLQPQGAVADQDWLTLGINVPTEFLKEWLPIASD